MSFSLAIIFIQAPWFVSCFLSNMSCVSCLCCLHIVKLRCHVYVPPCFLFYFESRVSMFNVFSFAFPVASCSFVSAASPQEFPLPSLPSYVFKSSVAFLFSCWVVCLCSFQVTPSQRFCFPLFRFMFIFGLFHSYVVACSYSVP